MVMTIAEAHGRSRLSASVAEQLTEAILEKRLAPGTLIGMEPDLMQLCGVSRATLREAIRQMESRGIARMRRGAGGGLIVAGTPVSIAAGTLATYFEFSSVTLAQLIHARAELEAMAAGMAALRVSGAQIDELRAAVKSWDKVENPTQARDLHFTLRERIARMSGNDMLWLATSAFLLVTKEMSSLLTANAGAVMRYVDEQREQKTGLVEAIAAGDAAKATIMVRNEGERFLASEIFAPFLDFALPDLVLESGESQRLHRIAEGKLGLRTALRLRRDIAVRGWKIGENIGTEQQFCESYAVSRGLMREALMLLEVNGVISIRRGREGGIIVGRPDPAAAIAAISGYMRFMDLSDEDMRNTVATIDIDTIGRAAHKPDRHRPDCLATDPPDYEALVTSLYPPDDQRSAELICDIVRAFKPQLGRPGGEAQHQKSYWAGLHTALARGDASLAHRHMRGLWGRLD